MHKAVLVLIIKARLNRRMRNKISREILLAHHPLLVNVIPLDVKKLLMDAIDKRN